MNEPTAGGSNHQTNSWRDALAIYTDRRAAILLALGFSAGMPFLLVFSTLTAWLRDFGVSKSAIGYFTWIGTLYAVKVLWAPVVDRLPLPWLTQTLGKRRSWMLLAQLVIALGLVAMSQLDPTTQLLWLALTAVVVAFGAATQDIAIDAFRIEIATGHKQAALASTYVLGYRIAIIATGAGAFYIADATSWTVAYITMGLLMAVGVITTLLVNEPNHPTLAQTLVDEQRVTAFLARNEHLPQWQRNVGAHFVGAVVCPFVDFVRRYGKQALLILALVGCQRISDISMAAMANPLYIDLGFTLTQIGSVTKVFGVIVTIIGGLAGGIMVVRYGVMRMMLVGAILIASTNLVFAWLSTQGASLPALTLTICGDNFSNGFASTVMIAWLSSLTSRHYTATQYALFSSLMNLPGKFIGGFSGEVVDAYGFYQFFFYVAGLGVPAIILILVLMNQGHAPDKKPPDQNSPDQNSPNQSPGAA